MHSCSFGVASGLPISDARQGSLLDFHLLFGLLAYDTIERIADDPSSEILLTDKKRPARFTCAQGKQSRNHQHIQDTRISATIDMVVGVICCGIKGPIVPIDRCENKHLINSLITRATTATRFWNKRRIRRTRRRNLFCLLREAI